MGGRIFLIIVVIKAAANSTDYFLNICLCHKQCWVFVWCISDLLEDQLTIPFHVELAASGNEGQPFMQHLLGNRHCFWCFTFLILKSLHRN